MTVEMLFGARAQLWVGVLLVVITVGQWTYWSIYGASVQAVFHVSMEALLFAAYAILATALGIRKTEHVQAQVAEIETAETVEAERAEVKS